MDRICQNCIHELDEKCLLYGGETEDSDVFMDCCETEDD